MQVKRCPACRGAKEVMSLGMRMLSCKTCNGIGHVADEEKKAEEVKPLKRRAKHKDCEDEQSVQCDNGVSKA